MFSLALNLSPGFLDLDAAAQLLQHKLSGVMVDDEHTVLLVRPLVSFEYCHGRRGALEGEQQSEYILPRLTLPYSESRGLTLHLSAGNVCTPF